MSKSKKKHLKLKGGNDCGGQCKERDNLVIFQRPPCQKKIDESSVAPPQPEDDDELYRLKKPLVGAPLPREEE